MTELEEKFYKTFEIKKWVAYGCNGDINCGYFNCDNCHSLRRNEVYPPINDHILLELLVILSKCHKEQLLEWYEIATDNIDGLKSQVLEDCIEAAQFIKSAVRKLFEE